MLIESVTCQKKFFAISFPSYQQNLLYEQAFYLKIGYLWGSVSALDFDDTLLFNPNKGGFHGIGGVNFINFVDRVLIRNSKSPTHRFRLCCSRHHSFHLNAWITAIKRKLQVLSLSIGKVKDYTLALAPFASEILVVLKLERNFELDISGSFLFLI